MSKFKVWFEFCKESDAEEFDANSARRAALDFVEDNHSPDEGEYFKVFVKDDKDVIRIFGVDVEITYDFYVLEEEP